MVFTEHAWLLDVPVQCGLGSRSEAVLLFQRFFIVFSSLATANYHLQGKHASPKFLGLANPSISQWVSAPVNMSIEGAKNAVELVTVLWLDKPFKGRKHAGFHEGDQ